MIFNPFAFVPEQTRERSVAERSRRDALHALVLDGFDSYLDRLDEGQRDRMRTAFGNSPDPRSLTLLRNRAFLEHATGRPVSAGDYPAVRDHYARQMLGTTGRPVTDEEFGSAVSKRLSAERAREQMLRGARERAAIAAMIGEPAEEALGRWQSDAGVRPNGGDTTTFLATYEAARRSTAHLAGIRDVVLQAFVKYAEREDSGELFPMAEVASVIATLPEKDRPLAFAVVSAAARAQGDANLKGFWANMREAMLESVSGAVQATATEAGRVGAAVVGSAAALNAAGQDALGQDDTRSREVVEEMARAIDVADIETRLRGIAQGTTDALTPVLDGPIGATFERGAYSIPQTTAYMAMMMSGAPGAALAFETVKDLNRQQLLASYPDLDPQLADVVAGAAAVPEILSERLQVFGRLAGLKHTREFLSRVAKGNLRRTYTSRLVTELGRRGVAEMTQEGIQDLMLPMVQDLAAALTKDVPDVDWGAELAEWAKQRPEVAVGLFPFILGGGIHNAAQRSVAARRLLDNPELLQELGLPQNVATEMAAAATLDEKKAILDQGRIDAVGSEGELLVEAAAKARARRTAILLAERAQELPTVDKEGDAYVVTYPDGSASSRHETAAQAETLRQTWIMRNLPRNTAGAVLTAEALNADGTDFIFSNRFRTLQDEVDEAEDGKAAAAQAWERVRILSEATGRSYEGMTLADFRVLGSNVLEFQEGIARSVVRLEAGATLATVIEEKSEADAKRWIEEGVITEDQLRAVVRDFAEQVGDAIGELPTRQDVIEAYSDMVQGYAFSEWRDAETEPFAGFAGLAEELLSANAEFFAQVARRKAQFDKLREAGTTTPVHEWVRKSLGAGQPAAARAVERTVGEVRGQPDFSVAPVTPGRMTTALRAGTRTIDGNREDWVADPREILPISFEAAREAPSRGDKRGFWGKLADQIAKLEITRTKAKKKVTKETYPAMPDDVRNNPEPDVRIKWMHDFIVDNLLMLWDATPEALRERAKEWYHGANRIAKAWAQTYGIDIGDVAAILAALSPQKDWFTNVTMAERLLDVWQQDDLPWTPEMDSIARTKIFANAKGHSSKQQLAELAMIEGKSWAQVKATGRSYAMARWARTYDEAHNDKRVRIITPEGDVAGYVPPGNGALVQWGSFDSIAKVFDVLQAPGDLDVRSNAIGAAHKVRNFYHNILFPDSPHGEVTIDTHAVAAGYFMPWGGSAYEVDDALGAAPTAGPVAGLFGTYVIYAEAYREAARRRGVLPREMQSVTWEAIRAIFKNRKSEKDIRESYAIWRDYAHGRIDQRGAVEAIVGRAQGWGAVASLSWGEPVASRNASGRRRTYSGPLSRSGVSRRGSRSRARGGVRDSGRVQGGRGGGAAPTYSIGLEGPRHPVRVRLGTGGDQGGSGADGAGRGVLSAEEFSRIAGANKASHKFGSSVDVYAPEAYEGYDLIVVGEGDQTATASISPTGEIGAVTKSPNAPSDMVAQAFETAVATGRVRWLNGFDTVLPGIYSGLGFEAVARMPFNDEFAPEGWDYDAYAKFNGGRPDVVFMRFTGRPGDYQEVRDIIPTVTDWDEAEALARAEPATDFSIADPDFFGQLLTQLDRVQLSPQQRADVVGEVRRRLGSLRDSYAATWTPEQIQQRIDSRRVEAEQEVAGIRRERDEELSRMRDARDAELDSWKGNTEQRALVKERWARQMDLAKNAAAEQIAAEEAQLKVDLEQLKATMRDTDLRRGVQTYEALVAALPIDLRGRIGGVGKLVAAATPDARSKVLLERIDIADRVLESALKAQYRARLKKVLKAAKPKPREGQKPARAKIATRLLQRLFDDARELAGMKAPEAEAELDRVETMLNDPNLPQEERERLQIRHAVGLKIAAWQTMDAATLAAGVEWLEEAFAGGRALQMALDAGRRQQVKEWRERAVTDLQAVKLRRKGSGRRREGRFSGKVAAFLDESLLTFEQQLQDILGTDSSLAKMFADRIRHAEQRVNQREVELAKEFEDTMRRVFGTRHRVKWARQLSALNTVRDNWGFTVPLGIDNAEIAADMSDLEATYFLQMWRQESVRHAMEANGWTDQHIARIRQAVSTEALAITAWIDSRYSSEWGYINRTFRDVYGMDMPQIRGYAPARFRHAGKEEADVAREPGAGIVRPSSTPGATRNRVNHNRQIRQSNALDVFLGHMAEMIYWTETAPVVRDLRATLDGAEVKQAIEVKYGEATLRRVGKWLQVLEAGGRSASAGTEFLRKWASRTLRTQSVVALGAKLGTLLKQTSAVAASMTRVPARHAVRGYLKALTGQPLGYTADGEAVRLNRIWRSSTIRTRVERGYSPEMRLARGGMFDTPSNLVALLADQAVDLSTAPIGFIDALWTTVSAAVAYEYAYRTTGSHSAAMDVMDDVVFDTAQPADLSNRSLFEVEAHGFARMIFLFSSEPRKQLGILYSAVKRAARGEDSGVANALVTTGVIMPLITAVMSAFVRDLMSDEEDEDIWSADALATAFLLELPHRGLVYAGQAADVIARGVVGEQSFQSSSNPLADTMIRASGAMRKMAAGEEVGTREAKALGDALAIALGGPWAILGPTGNVADQMRKISENLNTPD